MQVLLFASLAEAVGLRSLEVEAPGTVAELVALLNSRWPQLAGQTYRVAVDQCYATAELALQGDEEVALIPPVSGG